jgi:hypothetical protein
MSLRVAFDIDGVLADFRTAFQQAAQEAGVSTRSTESDSPSPDPLSSRDIKAIWDHVKRSPNWWTHLRPYEPGQLVRIYELARRWKWEVVFMTRRPSTAGDPVQFQTQWWIEQQGFYYPAVVTVPGSRGELANALRLDVIVDDQLLNCVDVVGGSTAKALLLLRDAQDKTTQDHAVSRGIGVVSTLEEAVDVLEHLHESVGERRGRLQRLADWFGSSPRKAPEATPAAPDRHRVQLRNE